MFSHKRLFTAAVVAWLGCLAQYCWAANVVTLVKFNPQTQLNEGLTIDKEGNIYVGFYNTGEIWKLTPSGKHGIFATLDVTSTNGGGLVGLALDDEGSLYVCDGSGNAATNGIWKVDKNGNARMLAATDPAGFPNGIAIDQAGNLFVTDSYLGEIWKITPSGEAQVWVQSPLLLPVYAYGANGAEFDRGALYVSNTDKGLIVRIPVEQDGSAGPPEVFVQSPLLVGADGVAFDVLHNLYVAVDYQNMVVEVSPSGAVTTLATATDGLDFPASTSFGQTSGQRVFLYWTSDGWNFGDPSLQKMDVGILGVPLPL
ncbi:MAG: SMP-30/gluconolactonase/LRE family protein [Bryobacteraceae bacterium]